MMACYSGIGHELLTAAQQLPRALLARCSPPPPPPSPPPPSPPPPDPPPPPPRCEREGDLMCLACCGMLCPAACSAAACASAHTVHVRKQYCSTLHCTSLTLQLWCDAIPFVLSPQPSTTRSATTQRWWALGCVGAGMVWHGVGCLAAACVPWQAPGPHIVSHAGNSSVEFVQRLNAQHNYAPPACPSRHLVHAAGRRRRARTGTGSGAVSRRHAVGLRPAVPAHRLQRGRCQGWGGAGRCGARGRCGVHLSRSTLVLLRLELALTWDSNEAPVSYAPSAQEYTAPPPPPHDARCSTLECTLLLFRSPTARMSIY